MTPLILREFHCQAGARWTEVNGCEAVADYGDPVGEQAALVEAVGVLDFSFRGRLSVAGNDRQRYLHGQVTNDVNALQVGNGCYAALITAKGKMVSDLNIYQLEQELLLDFEPGLSEKVQRRLEEFVIADDVQVIDAAPYYGLITILGPRAREVVERLEPGLDLPANPMQIHRRQDVQLGEIYLANQPRLRTVGFDLFVPNPAMNDLTPRIAQAASAAGGRLCGWTAFEGARIDAGIPRFGTDMDETNLPQEAGLESRAISYTKGCYIGQEIMSRIRTYGQVTKALRILRFEPDLASLPTKGSKLFRDGKEIGVVTSAVRSPISKANVGLGYVRKEANTIGTELIVRTEQGESRVLIVNVPFGEIRA